MRAQVKRIGLMIALLAAFPALASAEDGRPSQATLRAMGLSGMQIMSDVEAAKIRGEGFAVAGGISWAYIGHHGGKIPPAAAFDFHFAFGRHYAAGGNHSYADRLEVEGEVVHGFRFHHFGGEREFEYLRYSAGGHSWSLSL